jgi:integrase
VIEGMKNMGKKGPVSAITGQNVQTDTLPESKRRKRQRRPYTQNPDSQYLTKSEIDALFNVIKSPREVAIFRLMLHRGLRASEPGLLQLSDWNDRDGLLYVRRGKNSICQEYRITAVERNALRAWIRLRGRHPGPLFASQKGPRNGLLGIHRNQIDRLFRHYCALANLRKELRHLHVLKHSSGTQLSERGESAQTIQDWLGHRAASSSQIYIHYSKRRRDEAALRNMDWR